MGALARMVAGFSGDATKQILNMLIVITAVATLILGTVGWMLVLPQSEAGEPSTTALFFDALYRALLAFTLSEIYAPDQTAPASLGAFLLDITRYVGVITIAAGVFRVLLVVFSKALDRIRTTMMSGHFVVVGDGETARQMAIAIARDNTDTILHTRDRSLSGIKGVIVQPFDDEPTSRWMQNSFTNAKRIVVAETDEPATSELALNLTNRDHRTSKKAPQSEVFAVLRDPWVAGNFRRVLEDPKRYDTPSALFSVSEAASAARSVLRRHPLFLITHARAQKRTHVLIAGFGRLGEALLRELVHSDLVHGQGDPLITIIDTEAEACLERLVSRYPGLVAPGMAMDPLPSRLSQQAIDAQVYVIKGNATALSLDVVARITERVGSNGHADITAIYVATTASANPLAIAIGLQEIGERDGWSNAPVFLRSRTNAGLEVHPGGCTTDHEAPIPFAGWHDIISASGVLDQTPDRQARAIHNAYLDQIARLPKDEPKRPGDYPWELLAERFRTSCQRMVAHMPAKLWSLGFDILPMCQVPQLYGEPTARLADCEPLFHTASEAWGLAALEHRRWVADRRINGWRYGKQRDIAARRHPNLVPFDELDDETKAFDFLMLRQLKIALKEGSQCKATPVVKRQRGFKPASSSPQEDEAKALLERIGFQDLLDDT